MGTESNFSQTQIVQKPSLRSDEGVVAAQHRKAAEVGARILAEGGNAVDAAVATSFALGVVEPWMSGPGGGGCMIVQRSDAKDATVVDFGMKSPMGLDPADYPITGEGVSSDLFPWPVVKDNRNVLGATAVAVPGQVDGMRVALEQFGSGKLEWFQLLNPAIILADQGLVVDWYAQLMISGAARDLARFEKSRETFLDADGFPKASAWTALSQQVVDLGAMAETLRIIAEKGPREFYDGALSKSIASQVQQAGGCLSAQDLAAYEAKTYPARLLKHRQGSVFITPELTAGPTFARAFEILSRKRSEGLGPEAYVNYAEALMVAYQERLATMGDVEGARGSTTHFNVVDRDGMMVSVTQTLLSIFGSRFMIQKSGLLMNNGIMWFDPEPNKPNSLGPAKRCLSNMCPVIGERSDGYRFSLGASGGRKILPAVAQLSSFILDHDMDLETAFHTPRLDVSGGEAVIADDSLSASVFKALGERYRCIAAPRTVYPYHFACPSGVARHHGTNFGNTEIMSPWGDAVPGL